MKAGRRGVEWRVRLEEPAEGTGFSEVLDERGEPDLGHQQHGASGVLGVAHSDAVVTTGEVQAHLAEVYGAEVSRQTISTITDKVMDGMAEWQNRPLDPVYPVVFIDAIHVKIRVLSTIL
jgi:hypothetical protein